MKPRWLPGHQVQLLENGEAFYPAVFDAIRNARHEVLLETFIVFEDKVGRELHEVLLGAARRGVQVDVLVDGFGAADLSVGYVESLCEAGVRFRSFDPSVRMFGRRLNVLRRMHRKIVVVDGERAFVGGINYSADHLADFGPEAKQDYAVEVRGPVVAEIRSFVQAVVAGDGPLQRLRQRIQHRGTEASRTAGVNHAAQMLKRHETAGTAEAMFVRRDNVEHRNDIERHYRAAVRAARKSVYIANAYFFPGHRLLRELRRAARRGVEVHLILQGAPDVPAARSAASLLYGYLRRGGVNIHEYCERPMHGKVAVVDDLWATVGSSNLDPLSLSLNLEANVMLRDRGFATHLRERLDHLIRHSCKQVTEVPEPRWPLWAQLRHFVVFHFLRHYSRWASWLPRHAPRIQRPTLEQLAPEPMLQTQAPAKACDAG